jgi:hypothetical protein
VRFSSLTQSTQVLPENGNACDRLQNLTMMEVRQGRLRKRPGYSVSSARPSLSIQLRPLGDSYNLMEAIDPSPLSLAAASLPPMQQSSAAMSSSSILWKYTGFMLISLFSFVVYLVMPKGLRKAYCRAGRRRYSQYPSRTEGRCPSKTSKIDPQDKGSDLQSDGTLRFTDNGNSLRLIKSSRLDERTDHQEKLMRGVLEARTNGSYAAARSPTVVHENFSNGLQNTVPAKESGADSNASSPFRGNLFRPFQTLRRAPSASHPGIPHTPNSKILNMTFERLRSRGARLVAHGVQCDPKRVWIRVDEDTWNLSWQTEFPRDVTNSSGETTVVLMRGAAHTIALANVLYVDIGKKTAALLKTTHTVPASTCFSLLTQNGSLDLQTNSKLERDATVCCLSMILDQVHETDWRRIHGASPPASELMSVNLSGIGSEAFHNTMNDI